MTKVRVAVWWGAPSVLSGRRSRQHTSTAVLPAMTSAILILLLLCHPPRTGSTNSTVELSPMTEEGPDAAKGEKQGDCKCWIEPILPECHCKGDNLNNIPGNITVKIKRLTISESGIQIMTNDSFLPYRDSLNELIMMNNRYLEVLEPGLLNNLPNLQTLVIVQAPSLKNISDDLLKVNLPNIKLFRIMHTGLTMLPQIRQLKTKAHMSMLDLESNHITKIGYLQLKVSVDSLALSFNDIEAVEGYAFEGSEIQKLTLRGNRNLKRLDINAFYGIKSLRVLDLSDTAITFLPTRGLHDLEVLTLENVRTLKVFPSIYNFPHITSVKLTYAYHCCAFHFPSRHDPERHALEKKLLARMAAVCPKQRLKRSWGPPVSTGHHQQTDGPEGTFHQEAISNLTDSAAVSIAECGNLSKDYKQVVCEPVPDAFNPCEDLMGNWTLRVAVWIVAIAALLGNTAVLLVLLSSRFRMTVPKFLMCNLALADLCMGIYLLMIAAMDVKSIGDYFNYAIDWQSGYGCQIAGFLTVFSSELSILTLTVITSERWYTITYAIHMNKRLKLSTAVKIMAAGWVYAVIMASLPLLGVSGYYKTSICLPLEKSANADLAYLTTLLTFNGIAFWIICLCYGRMYCSIRHGRESGAALNNSDMTVAKRMALLVFTDFACWAPIAFFGLTALAGYPLIDVTNTKILLVFFYPLNSCANPYLYALLTHQYRRDVLVLLSRYGLCTERASRQKTGVGAGGNGAGGGARQRPAGRGSLLTTLTSLDCARQHSLGPLPEMTLRLDSLPNNGNSTV